MTRIPYSRGMGVATVRSRYFPKRGVPKSAKSALLPILIFFVIACAPALAAGTLSVATAQVDITGPIGQPMGGYAARKAGATGINDPLLAKVLLLKTGGDEIAFITYDLVSFSSERVAREGRKLGFRSVLQIASHTHSGPVAKNSEKKEEDAWFRETEDKVLKMLAEARRRYEPARLAAGETSILLGYNRRRLNDDGSVTMLWRNPERVPTSPVDPRVGILRFTSASGKTLAVMVHYACHAVVMGAENLQYSADWPGFMYRFIEKQLGAPAMVFFVPGAGGDINPLREKEITFGTAQRMGETLGQAVLAALKRMPEGNPAPDVHIAERTYDFKDRFNPANTIPIQVAHLLLDGSIGILAAPAEIFVSHQISLRDQSPLRHSFIFGYSYVGEGRFAGYIPTIQAAMEGGYGANYSTRVEVGAGERLVDDAIIWFYERLGKLSDVPDTGR